MISFISRLLNKNADTRFSRITVAGKFFRKPYRCNIGYLEIIQRLLSCDIYSTLCDFLP